MAKVTDWDREFAAENGCDAEEVAAMRERMEAVRSARPVVTDVTRWTKCPDCKHRASVTVDRPDAGTNVGVWTCNECGGTWVDEFSFTKAERAAFDAKEEATQA